MRQESFSKRGECEQEKGRRGDDICSTEGIRTRAIRPKVTIRKVIRIERKRVKQHSNKTALRRLEIRDWKEGVKRLLRDFAEVCAMPGRLVPAAE